MLQQLKEIETNERKLRLVISMDAGKIKIKISREKFLVPGCYIPRIEAKEKECWKFLDWQ